MVTGVTALLILNQSGAVYFSDNIKFKDSLKEQMEQNNSHQTFEKVNNHFHIDLHAFSTKNKYEIN